jgi:predicted transcriptional regulator
MAEVCMSTTTVRLPDQLKRRMEFCAEFDEVRVAALRGQQEAGQ